MMLIIMTINNKRKFICNKQQTQAQCNTQRARHVVRDSKRQARDGGEHETDKWWGRPRGRELMGESERQTSDCDWGERGNFRVMGKSGR
jgi:hypothetical protein